MATGNQNSSPAGRLGPQVAGKLEGRNGRPAGMSVTQQGNCKGAPPLPAKKLSKPRKLA